MIKIKQLESSGKSLKDECQRLKASNAGYEQAQQQLKSLQSDLNKQVQQLQINIKNLKKENQELKKLNLNLENEKPVLKASELQTGLFMDFSTYIKDESTKDLQIQIHGRTFKVHKFMFMTRCPALAEILKNNPEIENLNLVDISVETFEIILKFLYTDELPSGDGTNFLHLFAAAGKLKIEELVKHSATNVLDQVNHKNVIQILRLSVTFGLDDLKQKAFLEVKKKYKNIKFKDELIDDPEKLMKIIAMFKKKEEALKKFNDEFKELMAT
ncbi:hypothetical protein ACKWTF_015283 [Chironomus riparius]